MKFQLDSALLIILLAIVGLRPLISESFTSARDSISAGFVEVENPAVTRTLALDLVALAVACVVLLRACVRRHSRALRGLDWGIALFAVAAVVSTMVAGDQRPAINAALDLVTALVALVALAHLLADPQRIALALAVIVASAAVNVVDCVEDYRNAEETRAHYFAQRESFWAARNVALDSAEVRLFESRMRAGEASGFFAHSNVAGAYLLLGFFIAVGIAAAGWRRHALAFAGGALLVLAFAAAIGLTHSLGAIASALVGIAVLVIRALCGCAWVRRPRRVFLVFCAVAEFAVLAVVGYGLLRRTLPHPSLAFRWQYWTASAEMFRDHALTGVGAENFGHHYTAYKPITSPEEVKNPHNFIVQFATEFGVIGLLASVVLLVAGAWYATQPAGSAFAVDDARPPGGKRETASPVAAPINPRRLAYSGAICGLLIFAVRIPLLESRQFDYVYWMTAIGAITWAAAFAISAGALVAGSASEKSRSTAISAGLVAACAAGLLAFVVQDAINFAFFVPAARTTFLALTAVVIAARAQQSRVAGGSPAAPGPRPRGRAASLCTAAVAGVVLAATCWQLAIVAPAQRALRAARGVADADQAQPIDVHDAYIRAASVDSRDPIPAAEEAQWMLQSALQALARAPQRAVECAGFGVAAIDTAIARCPDAFTYHLRKAQLHQLRSLVLNNPADAQFAVAAARQGLRLYPENPRGYVSLGDALRLGNDCPSVTEAIAQYRQAIALDDQRPDWEEIRRFTPAQRQDIESRIAESSTFVATHCDGN